MVFVGIGTTEEMVQNLTHSYQLHGMQPDEARGQAEIDVYDIEHNTSIVQIFQVLPAKYRQGPKYAGNRHPNGILWKEVDTIYGKGRIYFPVGSWMLVFGEKYIMHCSSTKAGAYDALDRYSAMIDEWNEQHEEVPV